MEIHLHLRSRKKKKSSGHPFSKIETDRFPFFFLRMFEIKKTKEWTIKRRRRMKKERKLENVETGIDKTKTNSLFSIAMFGLLSLRILLD